MTVVTFSNKAGNLFMEYNVQILSDKFATIETQPCPTNSIQLSRAEVNLVASEGKGALTLPKRKNS